MIKAYLVGISTQYENEDIEVRYKIVKEDEILVEKKYFLDYSKPLVVTHAALISLLREIENFNDEEILVIINDPAFIEQVSGSSTSKNREVLKMSRVVREKLQKMKKKFIFKDVSTNYDELMKWNDMLKF